MSGPQRGRKQQSRLWWTRAGLLILAAGQGLPGMAALLLPLRFFEDFPLPGLRWVAVFPPYNEHLVRDFGALAFALSVVLLCAARAPEPLLVRAASLGVLAFTVPHLLFHLSHTGPFGAADIAMQVITLVLPVAVSAVLLRASFGAGGSEDRQSRRPGRTNHPDSPVRTNRRKDMTNSVQNERLLRRFQLWDCDGDGRIDRGDWESEAHRVLGAFETSAASPKGEAVVSAYLGMWNYLAGHAEVRPDGSLGFEQFRDLAARQVLDRGEEGFDEVLRPTVSSIIGLCDTDGDGMVDQKEFRSWIRAIGSEESTADEAFQAIDADGDGRLSVEELVQAVHKYHVGELDVALL